MRALASFIVAVSLFGAASGCAVERPLRPMDPKPVLLHLPGVAGDNFMERGFVRALRTGGLDADAHVYEWTARKFFIDNLQDYAHNRRSAQRFAVHIAQLRRAQPDRPILLTSESGGAGPLVWALEALPDDVQVDGVVLLAPALSPDYDLTRALRQVRGRMVAFTSPGDFAILDWGTRLFGTIDGKRVTAAGRFGFTRPPSADEAQYAKLVHVPYDPTWVGKYGHLGNHIGPTGSRFASGMLAPLLADLALGEPRDVAHSMARLAAGTEETGDVR